MRMIKTHARMTKVTQGALYKSLQRFTNPAFGYRHQRRCIRSLSAYRNLLADVRKESFSG